MPIFTVIIWLTILCGLLLEGLQSSRRSRRIERRDEGGNVTSSVVSHLQRSELQAEGKQDWVILS